MARAGRADGGCVKSNAEIVADMHSIVDAAAPPEMVERMTAAATACHAELQAFRMNVLVLCAMHGEETMRDHGIDRDSMMRITANELIHAAAFVIRSTKRYCGDEISPARFALVAYTIADQVLEVSWPESGDRMALEDLAPPDGSIRQAVHEDRLQVVRARIKALGDDNAIRVECIARSLRNLLEAAGDHAKVALDLVCEERGVAGLME